MTNTNITIVCGGQCGRVDMGGKSKITPPNSNICYNCIYKEQEEEIFN